jgi:hypothetical protein
MVDRAIILINFTPTRDDDTMEHGRTECEFPDRSKYSSLSRDTAVGGRGRPFTNHPPPLLRLIAEIHHAQRMSLSLCKQPFLER